METTGVKASLATMGELISKSGADWARVLQRRWLFAIVLVASVNAILALLSRFGLTSRFNLIVGLATIVVACTIFADGMRVLDSSCKIGGERFLRLAWIGLQVHLAVGAVAILPVMIVVGEFHQRTLGYSLLAAIYVFFEARFCFAWFLSEDEDSPLSRSWHLTAGANALASIVPVAIFWLPRLLTLVFLPNPPSAQAPMASALLNGSVTIVVVILASAWVYPLTARWLQVVREREPGARTRAGFERSASTTPVPRP